MRFGTWNIERMGRGHKFADLYRDKPVPLTADVVETKVPRANQAFLPLPEFIVPTQAAHWDDLLWHRIVEALRGDPNKTASHSRLLDLPGFRGNVLGARNTRRALSSLILGEIVGAPRVERVSRRQYRLAE